MAIAPTVDSSQRPSQMFLILEVMVSQPAYSPIFPLNYTPCSWSLPSFRICAGLQRKEVLPQPWADLYGDSRSFLGRKAVWWEYAKWKIDMSIGYNSTKWTKCHQFPHLSNFALLSKVFIAIKTLQDVIQNIFTVNDLSFSQFDWWAWCGQQQVLAGEQPHMRFHPLYISRISMSQVLLHYATHSDCNLFVRGLI